MGGFGGLPTPFRNATFNVATGYKERTPGIPPDVQPLNPRQK
jgi:hypothetical protein